MERTAVTASGYPDDGLLRRFLLDQLEPSDREQVEAASFADERCFHRIIALEESLIEGYVRGELAGDERVRVERQYLACPAGRQRIALARAALSMGSVANRPVRRGRLAAWLTPAREWLRVGPARLQMAVAAMLVTVVAGGIWAWQHDRRLRGDLADATAREATHRRTEQELRRQIAEARVQAERLVRARVPQSSSARGPDAERAPRGVDASGLVALTLHAGLTRDAGDETMQVRLSPETALVLIQLHVPPGEPEALYRVRIREIEGPTVRQQDLFAPQPMSAGEPLRLSVPARLLARGEYLVSLQRITRQGLVADVASYYFRVDRPQ